MLPLWPSRSLQQSFLLTFCWHRASPTSRSSWPVALQISTLIPAVVAASVCGFGVSPGDVGSAELVEILAIGVPSGLTTTLRTGSRPAVCEAVNALPAAALAKAGVSAVVATAIALGPSAGRCGSIAADVFGVKFLSVDFSFCAADLHMIRQRAVFHERAADVA